MRKKVIKSLAIVCGILVLAYVLLLNLRKSFSQGERHAGLDLEITKQLLDSSAVGLERYRATYGHYPQTVAKYFFDSIKTFVSVPDVYVYADSISENGNVLPIRKPAGKAFDYLHVKNTYLGAGRNERTIIYRPLSLISYKLYGVGENELDEGGNGDDVEN